MFVVVVNALTRESRSVLSTTIGIIGRVSPSGAERVPSTKE
jgi:hypothetical protein